MKRALVLALALAIGLPVAEAAEAQAMSRPGASAASAPRGDRHRGAHRPTPVQRWQRGLEQARARGDRTGRDPWNTYDSMPSSGFARSHFPESRLPRTQLWSGSCWARDCADGFSGGSGVTVVQRSSAPLGRAGGDAGVSRPAYAPPAVRTLDTRPVTRGASEDAPRTYAHRTWRGSPD